MRFHALTVTNIEKTIRDAVVLTLEPEDPTEFDFVQGQYLTFKRMFDDVELRRSYSICSAKHDGILQVGIKKVAGGAFSTWANSELQIGDTLEALPPMGNFFAPSNVQGDNHYLAFAGGSGITPVLSILRTGLQQEPNAHFTLVYANRNTNSIMFREELEDLKNTNLGRLSIIHVLEEDSQGIELFQGRVDAEKCSKLFSGLIDLKTVTTAYICGPEPMMLAISAALESNGLPKENIRFELFASGQPGRAKKRASSSQDNMEGLPGKVTLGGVTQTLVLDRETSLLDAALENNLDAPFACKSGICSTCKARVTEGEVEMIANHALEDYEVEAGFVLTCQCYVVSDSVSWNYDEAGH